ncbi:MAG: hypothetical protein ACQESE_01350 [Nanobdellota archaeon]
MYYGAQGLIHSLQQWGVIDVILPFILIFTIVFAVLEKIQLLSKDEGQNRKYSTIIAIVMAFAVVVPHVTGGYYYGFDAVEVINQALPQVGLLLVAIVMMLLTIGLWIGKTPSGAKGAGVWFTMISAGIVIAIFVASIGWWRAPYWLMRLLNSDIIALVIAILVFGLVIKWISSPEKKKESKDKTSAVKNFTEFLKGDDKDK